MSTVFRRLGPYEIVREIGRGGMAVVFLALDTRSGARVALKTVPQGTDREAREIFEAEQWGAELQRQFGQLSPSVPTVYEHGVHESYFYVAMDYLDGENLSDVITRGPLALDRAVAIAVELCRFLEDADRFEAVVDGRKLRSLLHGDLKPRNVRITSSGAVKVLDFGIAKALSLSRKVTRNDFGSVAYLSPERLETGEADRHADFWALGVLLYEMVSGTAPFRAPDTRRLERLILTRQPPPPLAERSPAALEAVIGKLLASTPAERYPDAASIRADLERFVAGQPTAAQAEGWPRRAADELATRRTAPAEDDERTRRTRSAATRSVGADATAATAAGPAAAASRVRRSRNMRRLLRTAAVLLLVAVVGNEMRVASAANGLVDSLPTQELHELPDAWTTYDRLADQSYLGVGTATLERSLAARSAELAGRVIADYRSPFPTVRENQWKAARDLLARAVATGTTDRTVRAALRYCEGHLHRINGQARRERGQTAAAQRELSAAIAAFREAAELNDDWPDPFLGLARTFVYGLDDVDRGRDALRQAERRGYRPSERDTAQLADGYRARGLALVRSARTLAGMPQERDYLTRASEAFREALDLYSRAGNFGDVLQNVRATQRALTQIEQRLTYLSSVSLDDAEETAPFEAGERRRWPRPDAP